MSGSGIRKTPRRPVELVAMCMDRRGKGGLHVAVTISTPGAGMHREVFECGPTPAGLVSAIRRIADWLERDYVPKVVVESTETYRTFVEKEFGTVEKV